MKYIELTKNEYEAIMESRYEGFMRKHGVNVEDPVRKVLRYIDIYDKRRKLGKITDEEYKDRIESIVRLASSKYRPKQVELVKDYASKDNRDKFDEITGVRPNKIKQKSFVVKSNDRNNPNRTNINLSTLSPNDRAKVERKIKILQSTDNYSDYCVQYRSLAKMLNMDPEEAIGIKPGSKVFTFKAGEDLGPAKDKEIFHTSDKDDMEYLRPSYRGTGYMLYPRNRVYGSEDKPINKNGTDHINNKAIYKTEIDDPKLKFKRDKEYDDSVKSGYIETDNKIKVKQIKKKPRL